MSEDIASKLQQLKDMLNNDQLSGNLKDMLSVMSSNSQQNDNVENQSNTIFDKDKELLISKVKKIMDKKKQIDDPRSNLLAAIKPYLNSKRQQHVDNFVKILNYTMLASILKEEDL